MLKINNSKIDLKEGLIISAIKKRTGEINPSTFFS